MIALLIEAAARSLLVALLVLAGLWAFRVGNVRAQKAAWGLVLATAILMPLLLPVVARWSFLPANAGVVLPADPQTLLEELQARIQAKSFAARKPSLIAAQVPQPHAPQIEESAVPEPDRASGDRAPLPVDSNPDVARPVEYAPSQPVARPLGVTPATLAVLLYLVVVVALLCRLLYGLGSAFRIWQTAEPVAIDDAIAIAAGLPLRSSSAVASPVTIGSAIVLPADYAEWDAEKLRVVLAHERSHVGQGDFYLQLLVGFYAAIFWFSPLGWWLKRKLSDLAEAISDRAALGEAASRSVYAQILLEFAAAPRPTLIGVAMARSGSLSQRIERLLNDHSFRQAFAGTRRRALLAVLLVPVALFAATALIRVQAAAQAQQPPEPPSQPAPAAAPTPVAPPSPRADPAPATQAEPPATGVAEPEPVPEPDQDMPSPPTVVVTPMPPGATPPAPRVETMPPLAVVVPFPPMSMVLRVPSLEGRAFVIARAGQDSASSRGYSYRYSSNGDSYAVITGDERQHMSFSGDIHTGEIDKARKMAHGNFLWFTRNGKSYLVDDPAVVEQIEAMYRPMEELGKQQEELGRKQEALGKQQEAIGRQQEQVTVPAPDISKEMAELNETMAKLQAKMGKTVTRDELADLQGKLGELQGRLGALQGEMGSRMGGFGEQQGKLGAEQGKLGAEQGRLGAEQGRLAMEVDRKVKSIIDESLKNGKAKPVE